MAKAPSLWKDGNKGTQRTRKLSTGNAPWSWRNGNRRFMDVHGERPKVLRRVRWKSHARCSTGSVRKRTARQRALRLPNGNVKIPTHGHNPLNLGESAVWKLFACHSGRKIPLRYVVVAWANCAMWRPRLPSWLRMPRR